MNVFIFGSEAYHDDYRWPLKDRRIFEAWKRETSWGQLFEPYAEGHDDGAAGARGAKQPSGNAQGAVRTR